MKNAILHFFHCPPLDEFCLMHHSVGGRLVATRFWLGIPVFRHSGGGKRQYPNGVFGICPERGGRGLDKKAGQLIKNTDPVPPPQHANPPSQQVNPPQIVPQDSTINHLLSGLRNRLPSG